jgi:hypothetical protein
MQARRQARYLTDNFFQQETQKFTHLVKTLSSLASISTSMSGAPFVGQYSWNKLNVLLNFLSFKEREMKVQCTKRKVAFSLSNSLQSSVPKHAVNKHPARTVNLTLRPASQLNFVKWSPCATCRSSASQEICHCV